MKRQRRHSSVQPIHERLRELSAAGGVLRARDLSDHGIHSNYLHRLHQRGLVVRVGRGVYVLAEADPTENRTLAEAAARVPKGVMCLLSALQFHGLTTQLPAEVWLALERGTRRPREEQLPLRVVFFSTPAFSYGVEKHRVEGVAIKVYTPAKTVADCFKYRNKLGLDVALEALRECRRQKRCTMDDLWRAAKVCRVANVIRPYLESMG
jgi:predicted transcriptional regulator of viral defense system